MSAIRIEPLAAHHLATLELQARQGYLAAEIGPALAADLVANGPAFAARAASGTIAAAGVLLHGFALPTAWGLLSARCGQDFVAVHRAVLRFLRDFGRAVQTGIEPGHVEGERWARLLGFARVGAWTDWHSAHGRHFERWIRHGA